jgi:hypothetical protein
MRCTGPDLVAGEGDHGDCGAVMPTCRLWEQDKLLNA